MALTELPEATGRLPGPVAESRRCSRPA